MGRRQTPAKRRGSPTAAFAAAAMLLLLGGLAALLASGPNIFGVHPDWTASLAAATNTSALTASRLLDSSSLLRSTVTDGEAAVAVRPVNGAHNGEPQQQGGSGAPSGNVEVQDAETQQVTSSGGGGGGGGSSEQAPDRMFIVAHLAEDLSWLPMHLGDIPTAVYQFVPNLEQQRQHCPPGADVDRPHECPRYAAGHVGREASAYLQYIHDHYNSLPAAMLFLHGHEKGWHRSSAVSMVHKVKWGALPFANIRHWGFTDWDCRHEAQQRGERPCSALGYCLTPREPELAKDPLLNEPDAVRFYAVGASQMLADHWDSLFKEELGHLPALVVEPACCAEFMVTRERVRQRPLSFYRKALDILNAAKDADSFPLAVSFEAVWHIVFGEPPIVHAVSKCDAFECSEEEQGDTRLRAPPVPQPYMLHHRWAAQQQQATVGFALALEETQRIAAERAASAAATTANLDSDPAAVASGPADADQLAAAAQEAMSEASHDSIGDTSPEHAAVLQQAAAKTADVHQAPAPGTAEAEQAAADGTTDGTQTDAEAAETQVAAAPETREVQQGAAADAASVPVEAASGALEAQPLEQLAPAAGLQEDTAEGQQVAATDGQAVEADEQPLEVTDLPMSDGDTTDEADTASHTNTSTAEGQAEVSSGAGSAHHEAQQTAAAESAGERLASTRDEAGIAAALQQALASTGQVAARGPDGDQNAATMAVT